MEDLSPADPIAALTGGESMAATNTISQQPAYAPPGTPSESTRDEVPGDPSPAAARYDTPVRVDAAGAKVMADANPDRGSSRLKRGQWNDLPRRPS